MAITPRPKGRPQKPDEPCPFGRTAEAIVRAQIPSVGAELDNIARRVGRPSSAKVVVSLRLDPDVIAAFRAPGPGWQARINEALKAALTRS